MQSMAHPRECRRALLIGFGADCYEVTEVHLPQVFFQSLRMLARDIDADLVHYLPGQGIYFFRFKPGAKRFKSIPRVMPEERLGHLAPGRVRSTQEQDSDP
jgi:hypothetical protein